MQSFTKCHYSLEKVKLSRLPQSFVTQNTAIPTTKSTVGSSQKSSQKPITSPPISVKSKNSTDNRAAASTSNSKQNKDHPVASTSAQSNGKMIKSKQIGSADVATPIAQDSPKKSTTKQSSVHSLKTLTGTPIKHKLVDRTNDNDVKAFSPRKTRSKVSKMDTAAASVADTKAKTKLVLSKETDADAMKKSKQPKKLNIETLNKNVAALLPNSKQTKAAAEAKADDEMISYGVNSDDVKRNHAKNVPNTGGRNTRTKLKLPQLDGAHDMDEKTKSKTKAKAKSRPKPKENSNSDSDFEAVPQKRIRPFVTPPAKPAHRAVSKAKKIDARVFSTDDEEKDEEVNTIKMNFWVEAYAEKEKKWITIDPVKKKVDCVDYVRVSE